MTEADATAHALERLVRAAEGAYSRYAGVAEPERINGVAVALQDALNAEPDAKRSGLLAALAERFPPPAAAAGDFDAAEVMKLREEVERLRQASPPTSGHSELSMAILGALIGKEAAEPFVQGQPDSARVVAVVDQLARFAIDLAKAFLLATVREGQSAVLVDRFRATLRGELGATMPAGSFAALLDEIRKKVGYQFQAFQLACRDGTRQMLRELDPQQIERQADEENKGNLAYKAFRYRGVWDTYQTRHEALSAAEDVYDVYFDGHLHKWLHRMKEPR